MVQYTYSSHRTRHIEKIRKQRVKYPQVAKNIVDTSDIILEILDTRYAKKMRNPELEKEISKQKKQIIFVLNKSDLSMKEKTEATKKQLKPSIIISCAKRRGIKELRDLIKRLAKNIENPEKREIRKDKVIFGEDKRIKVGVIGYPNTGKSSLINLLAGKSAAGVGAEAGYTKNIQKIKLSENIVLIDSPGVIPDKHYSMTEQEKISTHSIFGGKSYTQIKEPDLVVHQLMQEFPEIIQKHYKIKAQDSEELIEKIGRMKGFLKRGDRVNEDQAAREIIRAWQMGEIRI